MSIGSTIKKLRREHDMTQEQLAEYLGITANAISQWECDRTAPDISQLPLLAYVLDVSTDEILGVDARKFDSAVSKIIEEQAVYYAAGEFKKCVEILRKGLTEYPKSYSLMEKLAHVLSCLGGCDDEVVALCEKVIAECTDNEIRDRAFQDLIFEHKNMGRINNAVAYAKKMSHTWVSQEEMLMNLLEGEEAHKHLVEYVKFCSCRLMMCLSSLANHSVYSPGEKIALEMQSTAVLELLYPNKDYHYYAQFGADACLSAAKLYVESGNVDCALSALEKMAEYSIHFDTYDASAVNTSPAARGYCDGGWIPMENGNYCADKIWSIEKEKDFDCIRKESRYCAVIEQLQKNAK